MQWLFLGSSCIASLKKFLHHARIEKHKYFIRYKSRSFISVQRPCSANTRVLWPCLSTACGGTVLCVMETDSSLHARIYTCWTCRGRCEFNSKLRLFLCHKWTVAFSPFATVYSNTLHDNLLDPSISFGSVLTKFLAMLTYPCSYKDVSAARTRTSVTFCRYKEEIWHETPFNARKALEVLIVGESARSIASFWPVVRYVLWCCNI